MKKKLFSLFTFILLITAAFIVPVQAKSADIVLRSFDPQDNYDCFMEYSCSAGDDISYILEDFSGLRVNACTNNPFSASVDTVYFLQIDWYMEGQPQTDTEYDNIHFTIDSTPGRYEITGKVIIPEGFQLAAGLQPPTVRVFINILAADEKREITNLNASSSLSEILHPEIAYKDDENYIENLYSSNCKKWIGLTSDLTQYALLDLNWDFSSVDISREGTYEARLTLSVNKEFEDMFYLSDENACYTKTIYVSDSESWKFYVTTISSDSISAELSRTPAVWHDLEVYCLESDMALDQNDIRYSEFSLCDDPEFIKLTPGHISFSRSGLSLNKYYYFFFQAEGEYSNIICILDDGTDVEISAMGGNRDGGDSTETPDTPEIDQEAPPASDAEDILQPQPDADPAPPAGQPNTSDSGDRPVPETHPSSENEEQPDEDEEQTVSPDKTASPSSIVRSDTASSKIERAESGSASPSERTGRGITEISGTRLSYLYQVYGDYIPFSSENVTVKIPSSFLKSLHIKTSDILTVEVQESDSLAFRLRVLLNGREIFPDSVMKVTVRISGSQTPDILFLDGKETDIEITEINGYASFEIQSSGFYELKYQDSSPTKGPAKEKAVPTALLLVSAAVVLSVYFLHSKRKQVKNKK